MYQTNAENASILIVRLHLPIYFYEKVFALVYMERFDVGCSLSMKNYFSVLLFITVGIRETFGSVQTAEA